MKQSKDLNTEGLTHHSLWWNLVLPLVQPGAIQVGQETCEPRQEAVRVYLGPQHQAPSWPSFCSLHEFRAPRLLLVSF